MYVKHKKEMEYLVLNINNSTIINLPQIAGFNKNPYTILNAFHNAILKKQSICIMSNVYRNIIDIEDVVSIVTEILPKLGAIKNINIANPISTLVLDIIKTLEDILGEMGILSIVEGGIPFHVDVRVMASMVNLDEYRFNHDYLRVVLQKYYKPLSQQSSQLFS
jgi:nucleoside-diphosphate-sugar epimerase